MGRAFYRDGVDMEYFSDVAAVFHAQPSMAMK
jgi:hypothetical protein